MKTVFCIRRFLSPWKSPKIEAPSDLSEGVGGSASNKLLRAKKSGFLNQSKKLS